MTMLARIKPYSLKHGHVLRNFTVFGVKFQEEKGWYEVPDDLADYLRTVPSRQGDPLSPMGFDVCTPEQARTLDEVERKRALRADHAEPNVVRVHEVRRGDLPKAPPAEGVLTTADLPKAPQPSRSPSFNHAEEDLDVATDDPDEEPEPEPEGAGTPASPVVVKAPPVPQPQKHRFGRK